MLVFSPWSKDAGAWELPNAIWSALKRKVGARAFRQRLPQRAERFVPPAASTASCGIPCVQPIELSPRPQARLPLFYHVTFSLVTPIYRAWLILTPSTVQSVDRPLIALPTQLVVGGGSAALRTGRAKLDDEGRAAHVTAGPRPCVEPSPSSCRSYRRCGSDSSRRSGPGIRASCSAGSQWWQSCHAGPWPGRRG